MNTRYRFDACLNITSPLEAFLRSSVVAHSSLLAYANSDSSIIMIIIGKSTLVKRVHVARDFFTEILRLKSSSWLALKEE